MSIETVAILQGLYFFLFGIWPVLHIGSFMKLTGPKHDLWLVKTVGIILAVIGIALLADGLRHEIRTGTFLLAVGSALGLTVVEIVYVAKKVIAPIYLGDAVVELILVALWLFYLNG